MSRSTFGERFLLARLLQQLHGVSEDDGEFANAIGVGSSSVTAYKAAVEAPPSARVLAIARRCGVDPGWLAFGNDSEAPEPPEFAPWVKRRREDEAGAEPDVGHGKTKSGAPLSAKKRAGQRPKEDQKRDERRRA